MRFASDFPRLFADHQRSPNQIRPILILRHRLIPQQRLLRVHRESEPIQLPHHAPYSRTPTPSQANSPDGKSVHPSFGDLFLDEPLPINGVVKVSDKPGFGMTLNPAAKLTPYRDFFKSIS
jgi:hypothetical protein